MARTQKIKIINIILSSIDGRIASHSYESTEERRISGFTNEVDFKHMQKLTSKCDAVFISSKSILAEIGAFRVAHLRRDNSEPFWFIMTKNGISDFTHPFWNQENIPKAVFKLNDALPLNIIKNQIPQISGTITDFLKYLEKNNFKKIALLGGGELNGYFWEHDLVSELYLTLSPMLIGREDAPKFVSAGKILNKHLKLRNVRKKGNFLFLDYKVNK